MPLRYSPLADERHRSAAPPAERRCSKSSWPATTPGLEVRHKRETTAAPLNAQLVCCSSRVVAVCCSSLGVPARRRGRHDPPQARLAPAPRRTGRPRDCPTAPEAGGARRRRRRKEKHQARKEGGTGERRQMRAWSHTRRTRCAAYHLYPSRSAARVGCMVEWGWVHVDRLVLVEESSPDLSQPLSAQLSPMPPTAPTNPRPPPAHTPRARPHNTNGAQVRKEENEGCAGGQAHDAACVRAATACRVASQPSLPPSDMLSRRPTAMKCLVEHERSDQSTAILLLCSFRCLFSSGYLAFLHLCALGSRLVCPVVSHRIPPTPRPRA